MVGSDQRAVSLLIGSTILQYFGRGCRHCELPRRSGHFVDFTGFISNGEGYSVKVSAESSAMCQGDETYRRRSRPIPAASPDKPP